MEYNELKHNGLKLYVPNTNSWYDIVGYLTSLDDSGKITDPVVEVSNNSYWKIITDDNGKFVRWLSTSEFVSLLSDVLILIEEIYPNEEAEEPSNTRSNVYVIMADVDVSDSIKSNFALMQYTSQAYEVSDNLYKCKRVLGGIIGNIAALVIEGSEDTETNLDNCIVLPNKTVSALSEVTIQYANIANLTTGVNFDQENIKFLFYYGNLWLLKTISESITILDDYTISIKLLESINYTDYVGEIKMIMPAGEFALSSSSGTTKASEKIVAIFTIKDVPKEPPFALSPTSGTELSEIKIIIQDTDVVPLINLVTYNTSKSINVYDNGTLIGYLKPKNNNSINSKIFTMQFEGTDGSSSYTNDTSVVILLLEGTFFYNGDSTLTSTELLNTLRYSISLEESSYNPVKITNFYTSPDYKKSIKQFSGFTLTITGIQIDSLDFALSQTGVQVNYKDLTSEYTTLYPLDDNYVGVEKIAASNSIQITFPDLLSESGTYQVIIPEKLIYFIGNKVNEELTIEFKILENTTVDDDISGNLGGLLDFTYEENKEPIHYQVDDTIIISKLENDEIIIPKIIPNIYGVRNEIDESKTYYAVDSLDCDVKVYFGFYGEDAIYYDYELDLEPLTSLREQAAAEKLDETEPGVEHEYKKLDYNEELRKWFDDYFNELEDDLETKKHDPKNFNELDLTIQIVIKNKGLALVKSVNLLYLNEYTFNYIFNADYNVTSNYVTINKEEAESSRVFGFILDNEIKKDKDYTCDIRDLYLYNYVDYDSYQALYKVYGCRLLTGHEIAQTVLVDDKIKKLCEITSSSKCRLGNLDGIYDERLLENQPHGYGLYAENSYLTGEFVLNNGKTVASFTDDITLGVGNTTRIYNKIKELKESIINKLSSKVAMGEFDEVTSQWIANNLDIVFEAFEASNDEYAYKLALLASGRAGISLTDILYTYLKGGDKFIKDRDSELNPIIINENISEEVDIDGESVIARFYYINNQKEYVFPEDEEGLPIYCAVEVLTTAPAEYPPDNYPKYIIKYLIINLSDGGTVETPIFKYKYLPKRSASIVLLADKIFFNTYDENGNPQTDGLFLNGYFNAKWVKANKLEAGTFDEETGQLLRDYPYVRINMGDGPIIEAYGGNFLLGKKGGNLLTLESGLDTSSTITSNARAAGMYLSNAEGEFAKFTGEYDYDPFGPFNNTGNFSLFNYTLKRETINESSNEFYNPSYKSVTGDTINLQYDKTITLPIGIEELPDTLVTAYTDKSFTIKNDTYVSITNTTLSTFVNQYTRINDVNGYLNLNMRNIGLFRTYLFVEIMLYDDESSAYLIATGNIIVTCTKELKLDYYNYATLEYDYPQNYYEYDNSSIICYRALNYSLLINHKRVYKLTKGRTYSVKVNYSLELTIQRTSDALDWDTLFNSTSSEYYLNFRTLLDEKITITGTANNYLASFFGNGLVLGSNINNCFGAYFGVNEDKSDGNVNNLTFKFVSNGYGMEYDKTLINNIIAGLPVKLSYLLYAGKLYDKYEGGGSSNNSNVVAYSFAHFPVPKTTEEGGKLAPVTFLRREKDTNEAKNKNLGYYLLIIHNIPSSIVTDDFIDKLLITGNGITATNGGPRYVTIYNYSVKKQGGADSLYHELYIKYLLSDDETMNSGPCFLKVEYFPGESSDRNSQPQVGDATATEPSPSLSDWFASLCSQILFGTNEMSRFNINEGGIESDINSPNYGGIKSDNYLDTSTERSPLSYGNDYHKILESTRQLGYTLTNYRSPIVALYETVFCDSRTKSEIQGYGYTGNLLANPSLYSVTSRTTPTDRVLKMFETLFIDINNDKLTPIYEAAIDGSTNYITNLRSDMYDTSGKVETLKAQLEELLVKWITLDGEYQTYKAEHSYTNSEYDSMKSSRDYWYNEYLDAIDEADYWYDRYASMKSDYDSVAADLATCQSDLASCQSSSSTEGGS